MFPFSQLHIHYTNVMRTSQVKNEKKMHKKTLENQGFSKKVEKKLKKDSI